MWPWRPFPSWREQASSSRTSVTRSPGKQGSGRQGQGCGEKRPREQDLEESLLGLQEELVRQIDGLGSGKGDPGPLISTLNELGIDLMRLGRHKEALARFREAHRASLSVHRARHDRTIAALKDVQTCIQAQCDTMQALERYGELMSSGGVGWGDCDAGLLRGVGSGLEALRGCGDALDASVASTERHDSGGGHFTAADALNSAGVALAEEGGYETALEMFRGAHRAAAVEHGMGDVRCAHTLRNVGAALLHLHRFEEAVRSYEEALPILVGACGGAHEDVANAFYCLGCAHRGAGRWMRARDFFLACAEMSRELWGGGDGRVLHAVEEYRACL